MKISKYIKHHIILLYAFLSLLGAYFISQVSTRPPIFISKQDSTINFNHTLTQFFHAGQKRLISSAMWIATILESDLEHYKKKDMNSWMFLRFKTISEMEPRFYENYRIGSVYLSIVKDDLPGASYIYEKGLKEFPNDYFLLKNSAFHYEFEVGDTKRAYELYSILKNHPKADSIILSIAARLESEFGSRQTAFDLLWTEYEKLPEKNSFMPKKIFESLYALKAEIDLECLNSKGTNCSMLDLENNPYRFDGKNYSAQKSWSLFRIHKFKK